MIRFSASLVLVTLLGPVLGFAADNKACDLVTLAELQSVLGNTLTDMHGVSTPGTTAQICTGTTPQIRVEVRLIQRTATSGSTESTSVEVAKRTGTLIEVRDFGPIHCEERIPPESKKAQGYFTGCWAKKDKSVGAIEIRAKSRANMVSMDKLHLLAEKMMSRL